MGSGSWDASTYASLRSTNRAAGRDDFGYSTSTMASKPPEEWKVHETLDPKGAFRESRDSDDHPEATPVTVAFDVTGSMALVPRLLLERLPRLFGLLGTKGYLEHPHLMFAAIGDSHTDRVPLQVGQWESDNRADEQLTNILLEGQGGGTAQEGYELFGYFMARHTETDAWEKRARKGYVFIIGDEMAYDMVDPGRASAIIGDTLEGPIASEAIFAELRDRFEVFYLMPQGSTYYTQFAGKTNPHVEHWRTLLGPQNVVLVPDTNGIAEVIASMIGVAEGAVDLDDIDSDLREVGATDEDVANVRSALATVGSGPGGGVATSETPSDLSGGEEGTSRL